ncbi:hypothetical protein IFR05_011106 [Cadophora sp. M221]|nr:hypothetical protein IFR05_011106 [Cadophora sp. M221]
MEDVEWKIAMPLLSGCERISTIDWGLWGERDGFQDPETSRISKELQDMWPKASLRLIKYPWPSKRWYNMYTYTIPTANIVYISTQALKNRRRDFEPLGQLISNSPKLKVLHLDSVRGGDIWKSIRVPPIQELVIKSCTWNYTPEEVNSVWDFSQLQVLVIAETLCAMSFLDSACGHVFPRLRKLAVRGILDTRWGDSCTTRLNELIFKGHLLEELEINCQLHLLQIESVCKHPNLATLKIHDFTGFGNEKMVCPTLTVTNMAGLLSHCPKLRDISLDLDQSVCEAQEFIRSLSRFRSLQYIKLRMRSLLNELGGNSSSVDVDLEAAKELGAILGSEKAGLPMISLTLWIAGYNESTNRWTAEWRVQRQQGHIPERCFKFSWSNGCWQVVG